MDKGIARISMRFIIALFFTLFLGGCSLFGKGEKPEKPPEELMSEGMSQFADGNYTKAAEHFQELKDRYPYSKLAIHAELKLADALFKKKEFEEAVEAYKEFENLHPKNISIPYVIYQQGMCYFLRMRTIDRDQSNTKRALEEFERLKRAYPADPYSKKAGINMEKCLASLAEHEFYVGHFYFKNGHYVAALKRFEYLIEQYPDHGPHAKARIYIARCKEKLAKEESLQ
jgi:outer membrane protein assembly factor BamD